MTMEVIHDRHAEARRLLANDVCDAIMKSHPDETGAELAELLDTDSDVWATAWRAVRPNRANAPSDATRAMAVQLLAFCGRATWATRFGAGNPDDPFDGLF